MGVFSKNHCGSAKISGSQYEFIQKIKQLKDNSNYVVKYDIERFNCIIQDKHTSFAFDWFSDSNGIQIDYNTSTTLPFNVAKKKTQKFIELLK